MYAVESRTKVRVIGPVRCLTSDSVKRANKAGDASEHTTIYLIPHARHLAIQPFK